MSQRITRRLLLPLLLLARQPSRAQAPANYRIAGTVVSAIDHHPLQRTAVEILTTDESKVVQSTTSDEFGHFAFTDVPNGTYTLQGNARGYLATSYQEHDGFNTGILTGAGVDTESLVLELRPESTIAGTVVDEAAEPVEHATIRLFRQSHDFGYDRIVPARSASTNDLGHFELPRLEPGTYFLAVTARPWYAVHPEPDAQPQPVQNPQQGPNSGLANSVDPALDVAYPVTYYPGTTDPSATAPIVLHGGESLDLSFQLSPQPAVAIVLPQSQPQAGTENFPVQLRRSLFGQLEPITEQEVRQSPIRNFASGNLPTEETPRQIPTQTVITGLAPGDYYLTDPRRPEPQADDATPLHLTEHQANATLPDPSGYAHVHVALQAAHGSPLPPNLYIGLVRQNTANTIGQRVGQNTDPKGHADLQAPPGDYYFQVGGEGKTLFTRQILAGEQPLAVNQIHLAAGDSRFYTITVIPGTHTLKGIAEKNGKPCPGAFILLLPSSETRAIRTPFRQQSDLDGSWDITGLAPGSYTVFAIDHGWDLDWRRPGVLAPYLPAAVTVQIPDTTDHIQKLPQPLPVQAR
jgi:hypothetical protein